VEYIYEIELTTNGTNEYTIYLPIPIDIEENQIKVSKMIQEIKIINGNAIFSIINTEKGKALNITFNGNLHLKSNGIKDWEKWKDEEYDYNVLSLQNKSKNNDYDFHGEGNIQHWVWCNGIKNNATITFNINVYFGNINDQTKAELNGTITKNGWQIFYGSTERVCD
jgi:hypothetical protein